MTVPELKTKKTAVEKPRKYNKKTDAIITVKNLKTYYPIYGGMFKRKVGEVKAVDGVTFNFYRNETLGLVGESGCGKTTIGNTILRLVPNTDGEIYYEDLRIDPRKVQGLLERWLRRYKTLVLYAIPGIYEKNREKFEKWFSRLPSFLSKRYKKLKIDIRKLQKEFLVGKFIRKRIQMVFQDPDASLNPRWKVVNIIGEPLKILEGMTKKREMRARVLELLATVSMKPEHLDRYPHEFSGGQKQRIVIARALACNPEVIILDEPTSALDVSVQAQILNLLKELQREFNLSFLFITHDLSVVQHIADRIAVMYLGKFVETGTVDEVFYNPSHPYTRALLSARPTFDPTTKSNRIILEGDVPSPINPPEGCPFHPRCPEKDKHVGCGIEKPRKIHLGGDHYIVCLPFKDEKKSYEGMEYISD
ncbi:MAG: ABC transporter ATP-binding protein [Promethearchaeota archaeon]